MLDTSNPFSVPGELLDHLREADRLVETTDQPGQVLSALLRYIRCLDAAELTPSEWFIAADRLDWLSEALAASIERCPYGASAAPLLQGVCAALAAHQDALLRNPNVTNSMAKAARETLYLELSFLQSLAAH